ncbi:MAG TPA: hypothetical protein VFT53_05425 [Candidatus Saccharimonadales bacterium]|nr:hypothetical protein [Candidatus Saccharimonadales bacterium]
MAAPINSKDTIYVDVDDEITTIIDKVRSSSGRVVALVLPKRASVFQSIVNMKLLKRSADSAKKHLVLITTEPGLMPLAGTVGLHVAATPQSKPEIPSAAPSSSDATSMDEDDSPEDAEYTAANAGSRPIGELAGTPGAAADEIETLDVPDDEEQNEPQEKPSRGAKQPKPAKDKHLKVPNFNKFRMMLFAGVVVIVLLVFGLYEALAVLPKANIVITTQTSGQNVSLTAALTPGATALDTSKGIVPAKVEQQQKTLSQQVATTGQQNNGTTATGTITMSAGACSASAPQAVPAGTGVSTGGLTYITQGDTSFSPAVSHGQCTWQATGQTNITAQSAGAKYNVSSATFSVAGRSDVTATGSAANGTDNVIHTVTQADIDSAKQKLGSQDTASVQTALEQTLQGEGLYPLSATFNAGTPVITTSNNVGDQADNVTVTEVITYTMYGAKQTDLDTLIKANVAGQIDMQNQAIVKDGLASATISVTGTANNAAQISLQTTATVGPDINVDTIKKQVVGKRAGDVKSMINAISGVTNVDVQLSPFWVGSVPSHTSKITITINGAK